MKGSPPIVTVPVRCEVELFAAMEIETLPLPDPLVPLVTVSQPAPLVASQVHELPAVTATVAVSAATPAEREAGEML